MVFLNADSEGIHAGEAANFVARFQQLSGPAAAKGIEDTALYLYVPLVSLNEVGGTVEMVSPDSASRFHEENQARGERFPNALLAATTHDTKRSSDVRSRLDVLSQIPDRWLEVVRNWHRRNRPLLTKVGRRLAPDPVAEYLFYQILVALWPADGGPEFAPSEQLVERIESYMIKAVRESKRRTSWVHPDTAYEEALIRFLRTALDRGKSPAFLAGVRDLVSIVAPGGFWNGLSKIVLQFTSPGGPDIYQGDELWNFVLVDPDNRRPVDYERRRRLLDEVIERSENPGTGFVEQLFGNPGDPRSKLFLVWKLLQLRRRFASAFDSGSYQRLSSEGELGEAVLAFSRSADQGTVLVIASRFQAGSFVSPLPGPMRVNWGDTRIPLREPVGPGSLRSWMTGRKVPLDQDESGPYLTVANGLGAFPADVLVTVR
jgi:(1->4)-alpha-D-glucan 1-alpha-D-glucosylmutase